MAVKIKWYVVWEGRAPGVYNSWEECKLQVENYPNAKYKSFTSKGDAIAAFRRNYGDGMELLRNIATKPAEQKNYDSIAEIIKESIAVDAACSGNPGVMEYRGVWTPTGEQIFHKGPFPNGTNNIGEFLALVHGLALLKQKGVNLPIYTDSITAMAWVRDKRCKSKLDLDPNSELAMLVKRAEAWLKTNNPTNRIIKWDTKAWGEVPADFGRK
ncbi:MAG: ribonuclease H family protein [Bacteroidales bacterium]